MLGVFAAVSQAGLSTVQGFTPFPGMASGIMNSFGALSPVKSLSDKEYEDLLLDKLLKVDVEIALLDDQIADLRAGRKSTNVVQQGAPKIAPR